MKKRIKKKLEKKKMINLMINKYVDFINAMEFQYIHHQLFYCGAKDFNPNDYEDEIWKQINEKYRVTE